MAYIVTHVGRRKIVRTLSDSGDSRWKVIDGKKVVGKITGYTSLRSAKRAANAMIIAGLKAL